MMTEQTTGSNLIIPADRVPVAAYQAIYHKLTGRVETVDRQYRGNYLISVSSIESLYRKLDQSISQYQLQGKRAEFTVSFFPNENYRFTSLERLLFANLAGIGKTTSAVGLEYDFLIILPSEISQGENIPQRYRVLVTVEEPQRILDRQRSRSLLGVHIRDPLESTGSVSINYTDYSVSRTIATVVDEWFSEIEFDDEHALSSKSIQRIGGFDGWIIGMLPISILVGGIAFEPAKYANILSPIRYLLLIITLSIIGATVSAIANSAIADYVKILSPQTRFQITSGDDRQYAALVRQRKSARKFLGLVFSGVIVSSLVGLLTNYMSAKIFNL